MRLPYFLSRLISKLKNIILLNQMQELNKQAGMTILARTSFYFICMSTNLKIESSDFARGLNLEDSQ